MLDAGPDLAVGGVVLLLPSRQSGPAAFAAVRDGQTGALIAAVRDDRGPADGGLRDSSHALQSLRLPVTGRATTRRGRRR